MNLIRLRSIASDTLGIFTPEMAVEVGLSRSKFGRLRRSGRIRLVCGRGFTLSSRKPSPEHRAVAAYLTWPDAIVCFRTAAVLHGLPIEDDGLTHVLVPDGRPSMKGLVAHHWSVRPVQVEHRGTWSVTDRLTTLADVLGRLPDLEAWGRLAWMATRDIITAADVQAQLDERSHLYGVVRLRTMAAALARGAVSVAEVELHKLLEREDFAGWLGNQKIFAHGRIVAIADVLFVKKRVIIEYDGRLAHPEKRNAEDRRRDKLLRRLGYHVIHVRWERLMFAPEDLLDELRDALRGRSAQAA